MIFKDEPSKTVVKQRIELFQRIRSNDTRPKYRRIASLPNADDELLDYLNSRYKMPLFYTRVVTELY